MGRRFSAIDSIIRRQRLPGQRRSPRQALFLCHWREQGYCLAFGEKQYQSSAGQVTVRVEKRSSDFLVEFINPSASGNVQPGRGSCYIQRSLAKGNYILQARILLEDDPGCFLTLYPSGSGTRGDIVMYGASVKKGLYFSDMIYRILLLGFSDIVDATKASFDWSQVFEIRAESADSVAAQLRAALAASAAPQPAASPLAPLSQPSPLALGFGGPPLKLSYAAAPSLPQPESLDPAPTGPRPLRIATAVDKATSAETLLLDFVAEGEGGARELAAVDGAPAFVDDRQDPAQKPAYVDFPRYDHGIGVSALRASVYLDLQANPQSIYALVGEDGLRATLVPSYDEAGRLSFAFFAGGKETSFDAFRLGSRSQATGDQDPVVVSSRGA